MKTKRVGTIVVTFNRKKMLKECIEALLKQSYDNQEILVIDNASTDGTREEIAKLLGAGHDFGNMELIYQNTGANLGGAGGFQYGVRWAVEHGYDYIWLMDDDCIPETGALAALLAAWENLGGKCGWLSSKVLWKDGSLCTMNVQKESLTGKVKMSLLM